MRRARWWRGGRWLLSRIGRVAWPNPDPRRAWDGRPIQPGDLRLALHEPAWLTPPQDRVHQARHQLPQPTRPPDARRTGYHRAGL